MIGFDFSILWKERIKTGFQEMKIELILVNRKQQFQDFQNFRLKYTRSFPHMKSGSQKHRNFIWNYLLIHFVW